MKKVNVLWFLLDSLFLIVFNLLFFMFVEDKITPVWISYGFIHFAYILLLLTPLLVTRGSAAYIYGRSLYGVTATYFLIELAAGVALIIAAPGSLFLAMIIQVLLAAVFLAWLFAHLIANEHTAGSVERRNVELKYVKESSSQVHAILQQIEDRSTARKVEKVYDLLHGSPVKSDYSVYAIEREVMDEINRLNGVVATKEWEQIGRIADKILQLAKDRNRKLKLIR